MPPPDIALFEDRRPFLIGLAYRILGSLAEAEDAVQDTFLKWQTSRREDIANPAGWLTSVCTRHCIDMLRSARRSRVDYVGAWLPEPVQTMTEDTPERIAELSSTLSLAFMLVRERLVPRDRAAYLLREIFDRPYADIAASQPGTGCLGEPLCHLGPVGGDGHMHRDFPAAVSSGTARALSA